MRRAQHLALGAALLGTVLSGTSGCFRPNIAPRGFRCSDAGACPDNFFCAPSGFCYPNGSDAGATGGKGGSTGTGGTGGVDMACVPPVASPNCPSDAGTDGGCDPVCNTGCGHCYEKCSVDTTDDRTCNEIHPTTLTPGGLLGFCTNYQSSPSDNTTQSDNCDPGQFCYSASACAPGPRCYQFCRTNSDCQGGASCSRSRDGGTFEFCDVPPQNPPCTPLSGSNNTGCPNGFICYLSPSGTTTLCDCQFDRSAFPPTTHGTTGDPCNHSRDCLPGLVCAQAMAFSKTCQPVCVLPADGGVDTCTGGCRSLGPGSLYGWCAN